MMTFDAAIQEIDELVEEVTANMEQAHELTRHLEGFYWSDVLRELKTSLSVLEQAKRIHDDIIENREKWVLTIDETD